MKRHPPKCTDDYVTQLATLAKRGQWRVGPDGGVRYYPHFTWWGHTCNLARAALWPSAWFTAGFIVCLAWGSR